MTQQQLAKDSRGPWAAPLLKDKEHEKVTFFHQVCHFSDYLETESHPLHVLINCLAMLSRREKLTMGEITLFRASDAVSDTV